MIREHLKKQEEDAGGKDKLHHEKLILKGSSAPAPVYRLCFEDLAFNKANGRIKAEVLEKEAELGHELSASSIEDQRIIKQILLAIRPGENEKIREDLKKYGQMAHGIITCDGVVINGNRRKALLEELYGESHEERYKYLEVQVLPSDITKAELWLIEAGIQMSAPQQLDYSPINHLLKLREGKDSGLKIEAMAAGIYGVSEDEIKGDLERLDLIDEYLRDFIRKPERYYLAKQLNEHFIDLQEILHWANKPRGNLRLNWKPDASDINELKLVAFYYIRIKFPHLRIRGLRDLFATKESWEAVKQALTLEAQLSAEERTQFGLEPTAETEQEEDDFEEAVALDAFSTVTEEKDLREEEHWKGKHAHTLKSYYEDAKEQEQIVKDSERPLALASRALKNIEAIPADKKKLTEPELDDVLRQIISRTNELRKIVQKPPLRKHIARTQSDIMSPKKKPSRKGRR